MTQGSRPALLGKEVGGTEQPYPGIFPLSSFFYCGRGHTFGSLWSRGRRAPWPLMEHFNLHFPFLHPRSPFSSLLAFPLLCSRDMPRSRETFFSFACMHAFKGKNELCLLISSRKGMACIGVLPKDCDPHPPTGIMDYSPSLSVMLNPLLHPFILLSPHSFFLFSSSLPHNAQP